MMISTFTYVSIWAACVKQETNEENAENRRKLNMGGRGIGRRRLGESQKKMPTFYYGNTFSYRTLLSEESADRNKRKY